jgi:VCBS repeat-containing protein
MGRFSFAAGRVRKLHRIHKPSRDRRLRIVEQLEHRLVMAAPVAVNDSFDAAEDSPLAVIPFGLNAGFNIPPIVGTGATWQYLDKIQLAQSYPTDATSQAWNAPGFNIATSSPAIGDWETGTTPLHGGGIDAFQGVPGVLDGVPPGGGGGGQATVNTYLFRHTIQVSAEDADVTEAVARVLCDDGCVGYLNGQVAFRLNMDDTPQGSLTTSSSADDSNGTEGGYTEIPIDLASLNWHQGANVLAVEVHQSDLGSSDVGFDMQLALGDGGTDGFSYADDALSTDQADLAAGTVDAAGGFTGGALTVRLNQAFFGDNQSSGGWLQSFDVPGTGVAQLSLRYRMRQGGGHDNNEFGEAVLMVDGVRYGSALNNSLVHRENGTQGGYDSGWQQAAFDIPLTAGDHTLTLAAYNASAGFGGGGGGGQNEWTQVWFDDISFGFSGGTAGVLENDTDADGNPLTAAIGSQPQHGEVMLNADGTFVYTPDENYFGPDSFTYRANDGTANSNTATVNINVAPVNDRPIAAAKQYDVVEDDSLIVGTVAGLLVGATDIDNPIAALSTVLVEGPANGEVVILGDGSFTYVPNQDFAGLDTFQYAVTDGTSNSVAAAVGILVSQVNDAPRTAPDNYSVLENTTLVADRFTSDTTAILLPRGSDWRYLDDGSDQGIAWRAVDYDDSAWTQENAPNNNGAIYGYGDNEATVVGFGGNANNKFITTYFRTYFDVANASAVTELTARMLRDDGGAVYLNGVELFRDNLPSAADYMTTATTFVSGEDEFTFFNYFNLPLDALVTGQNLLAVEIHQDSQDSSDIGFDIELEANVLDSATALVVNDRDPEGDAFTVALVDDVEHGVLTLNDDGTFTYVPDANYQGPDSFSYTATDGTATSAPTTVTIDVMPGPNDIPVAAPDAYTVDEDGSLTVSTVAAGVLNNDTDGDLEPLTASILTQPANGTATLQDDGTFTYTPNANFFGVDTFTYRAWDGSDFSSPGTVTITVNGIEDAPVAVDDHFFVQPGATLILSAANAVRANDFDADGNPLAVSLVSPPAVGSLSLPASGSMAYSPAAGFRGVVTFTYRINDGDEFSNVATVTLTVNSRPVATGGAYQSNEDATLSVNAAEGVLLGDTDAESSPLTAVLVAQAAHGTVTLAANGSFTYTPVQNYVGPDSFTYSARDGGQNSTPATISITVNPVNDAPQGVADEYDVEVNNPLSISAGEGVLANDIDVDSATLSAVVAPGGMPQFGALSLAANGSFTYTPNPGYIGPDSFTYIASDGSLSGAATTVTLNVTSASNLIAINEIMYHPSSENDAEEYIELINQGIGAINLTNWQFDRGIDFTFPAVSIPGGGTLVIAANPDTFSAKYPSVTNVVGGWSGQLSNGGERIRLVNRNGLTIDEIEYADEGDWAVRRQQNTGGEQGWVWISDHDGGGRSLELINPRLLNERGQNWTSSVAVEGTPGAANSVASMATAPLIGDVIHSPAVPRANQQVIVTAALTDLPDATITGTVRYRVSTTNPGPFLDAPMFDDGQHGDGDAEDGVYGAFLPGQSNMTVVEFYVLASNDSGLSRTLPGPTTAGGAQGANLLYQVDETTYTGTQPVYRVIMTAAENAEYNSNNFNDQSDAQMNATFINVDGTGTDVVYNVGIRRRGSGSRGETVPNWRMNIPSDRVFQGVTEINLNTQYTFTQLLGMQVFELAGMPFEEATAVQVHVNGTNRATQLRQAGSHVRLETVGADWAENHYPNDSEGNFYSPIGGFGQQNTSDLAYFGENPTAYQNLYDKQTNTASADRSDLIAMLRALDPSATSNDVFVETVKQVIDVDQWMRFFAMNTLLVNEENGLINGEGDDYNLYAGVVDPRFKLVVHDMDSVFPANIREPNNDPALGDTIGSVTRDVLNELRNNPRIARLLDQPEFLNLYYHHLIDLADKVFNPNVFNALVDNALGSWVQPTYIEAIKTFAQQRVAYVRSQVPPVNIPPVATIDGEPPAITPLRNATLTVGGAGVTTYQYSLNGGPLSSSFTVSAPISLTNLANGTYTVTVIGRNAAGQIQPASAAAVSRSWTVDTAYSALRISEVMADNQTNLHEGTRPDMIELFNAGATAIDLSGKSISDRPDEPLMFVFPSGTTIPAGGYLTVYADSANTSGLHLGFALARTGETIYLFDSAASGGALLDKVEFGNQLPDRSIARDAQFQWRLSNPTFGVANNAFVTLSAASSVRINEWLSSADELFDSDMIELHNPLTSPVAIGGMYLTDNPNGFPAKHRIAPNSFIAAQGFAVYFADEDTAAGPDHLNFRLSADRESIGLLDRHVNRVDTVIFAPQRSDVSQGRTTESSPLFQSFSPPTFGLPNSTSPSLPDPVPLLDHLRITELMYNPAGDGDLEFIELHNTGTVTLNLEGVRLRNGVDFTFPAMTLAPGAYTVVVADQAKFVARYGSAISVAGQYAASFNNAGENVELALPLPYDGDIHDFTYDDAWYPNTDGGGKSLVIGSPLFDRDSWDQPTGWRASYALGGSPGRADLLYADQNGDGSVGLADLMLLRNKIGTANLTGDLNNDGVVNVGDVASFVSSYRTSTTPAPSPAASSVVVARSARDAALVSETQSENATTAVRARRSSTAASDVGRESGARVRARFDAATTQSATDQAFADESTTGVTRSRILRSVRR